MKKKWLIALTSSSALLLALTQFTDFASASDGPGQKATAGRAVTRPQLIATAGRVRMRANVRDGKALAEAEVELKDLTSTNSFDGKYFKIVAGTSDEPISFNAEPGLVFRAATVYHHLGIDYERAAIPDFTGRPVPIVRDGKPIRELLPAS